MNTIQLNKFVDLHDGEKIIFCKFDFLSQASLEISRLNHDVILILAGSDMCLYNHHMDMIPKNVKKVFSWNCCVDLDKWSPLVQPIPRGIEVSEAVNKGSFSWCGYELEGEEKRRVLSSPPSRDPTKFIYANFRVNTNPSHRTGIKEIAQTTDFITWQEPSGRTDRERYLSEIPYMNFVDAILDHEAVLCAQGNDNGDNLRVYETLYLKRIPLTFNPAMYRSIHHMFPVVLIENNSNLKDLNFLKKEIEQAKCRQNDTLRYLSFDYWKDMILEEASKI